MQSAGILLYRNKNNRLQVLLVHPGGPYWANKDAGAWSIPKGEFSEGEEGLDAAKREFEEETGQRLPEGVYLPLGSVKQKGGKTVFAWAREYDIDLTVIDSNKIEIEWPPRSGRKLEIPEVDRAEWLSMEDAKLKINPAQVAFVERLVEVLAN